MECREKVSSSMILAIHRYESTYVAQINPTIGDIAGNTRARSLTPSKREKKSKADVVLFPELCLTGYPPEDFLLLPHFISDLAKALDVIVTASKGIVVVVGTVRSNPHLVKRGCAIALSSTMASLWAFRIRCCCPHMMCLTSAASLSLRKRGAFGNCVDAKLQ